MCGFVGVIHNDDLGRADHLRDVRQMNRTIEHRGPDDEGYFENKDITAGFRRLSIIDLQHGKQPMAYLKKRYWVVFNGEIYNYVAIREELQQAGYQFETDSDTEVLVAAYRRFGQQVVTHLRGMFAFVIWDTVTHEVFGARDPFGIKPLYLDRRGTNLYFASEKKAFMARNAFQDISEEALQNYMTFQYVPGDQTMTETVTELQPGHYFLKRPNQQLQVRSYFKAQFQPQHFASRTKLQHQLRQVLADSVTCHMRSDVPVGAFLSGGIDSSIVVALAQQVNPNLQTFSVGFEQPGYSELDLAQETAAQLGVANTSRIITPQEFMAEFPRFVYFMDDPVADPAAFAQYFLAQLAREHCKVALTGEGADELFGGYNIYHEPQALRLFDLMPGTLKEAVQTMAQGLPQRMKGRNFLMRGTTPLPQRFVGNAKIFTEDEKARLLKRYTFEFPYERATADLYQRNQGLDAITRMQDIDLHLWLPGDLLHNADRTSMAAGLELRTPFVDPEVFAFARRLPTRYRVTHRTTKYLLRQAAQSLLPKTVVNRKKLGFPIPIRVWLKDELHDWAVDLIQRTDADALINREYCLQLLDEHCRGTRDNSRKLWTILTFLMWHRVFVTRKEIIQEDQLTQLN